MLTIHEPPRKLAGGEVMTKYLCAEEVWTPGHWSGHRCGKTARFDPNHEGVPTKCGIHCRDAKAKRQAKQDAETAKWRARSEAASALKDARNALEAALRAIAAGHNDPRALAIETIATLDAATERAKA